VAADFTLEMMRIGKDNVTLSGLDWSAADALCLPFLSEVFDAVVSGFLMRNVSDIPGALREQHRVLAPGRSIVILDTTRPPHNLLSPLINFHLHTVIPALGQVVTGSKEAYTYLPETTDAFLVAEKLAALMIQVGFREVGFRRLMLGTIAIHWGRK
jgi:demethylmenaquinone methyltransferase/2-methoxy-6-polyprenyl-1,4-benzoquinol methylase